jgi:hypothetical protein
LEGNEEVSCGDKTMARQAILEGRQDTRYKEDKACKTYRLSGTNRKSTICVGDSCNRMNKPKIFLVVGVHFELIKEL